MMWAVSPAAADELAPTPACEYARVFVDPTNEGGSIESGVALADQPRRELVDLRNRADGLIYSTERTLEEFAENVHDDDRVEIEKALEIAKQAAQGEDSGALRAAVDELSALTYKMTEVLYAELGGDDSE